MAKILGHDVAQYQGDINFDLYKNHTNFVIPKATEGVGYTDPKFKRNQNEARRVGIPLGYYHFARPDLNNTPEKEASWFLSVVGELREGEVLCLDYEPNTQVQAHVDWCKKWLDYVFEKTGVRALIYLNQSQIQKFNWKVVVDGGYGLWVAAYLGNPHSPDNNNFNKGIWPFAAMQQWTSSQKVPGILNGTGNVDGNVFFGDLATFKKYGYKKPVTPPSPPSEDWKKKYEEEHEKSEALWRDKQAFIERNKEILKKLEEIKNLLKFD